MCLNKKRVTRLVLGIGVILLLTAAPAAAQKLSVRSATPNTGAQETIDLDVVIDGTGFGPGAQAKFVLSGTDNPDGIRVKNTRFVNNTQLVATVDIDATASLALFDIKVAVNGRSGKGTDLFQVIEKVAACESGITRLAFAPLVIDAWPKDLACGVGAGGALDCNFGNEGLVTTTLVQPQGALAVDMITEADGRLVVLATGRPPGVSADTAASAFFLLRFQPNGAIDSTFGAGGLAHVAFTSQADWEKPTTMARQPDGRILVAGYYFQGGNRTEAVIARFLPNGTLDSSFGSGGRATVNFGVRTDVYLSDVALQADGKIVALAGGTQFRIARLMPNGVADSTFGTAGVVTLPIAATSASVHASGVAFQKLGAQESIVFAGNTALCQQSVPDFVVGRVRLDGTLDTTFGPSGSGWTAVDFAGGYEEVYDMALDPLGRILLAGRTYNAVALARFTERGMLDASFGSLGAVLTHVTGTGGFLESVLIDAAGRIVAAGWHSSGGSDFDFLVQRYLDNGTPDPTFGLNGSVVTVFPNTLQPLESARAIAIQPSGRIVAAGRGGGSGSGNSWVALAGYVP